jgi:hypothetical protein
MEDIRLEDVTWQSSNTAGAASILLLLVFLQLSECLHFIVSTDQRNDIELYIKRQDVEDVSTSSPAPW